MADYSNYFRVLVAYRSWNDTARVVYIQGLLEELKAELAARDVTLNLEMSIALTIWSDNCVRERWRERVRVSHAVSPTILDRLSGPAAEPPMPSLFVPPSVVAVDPAVGTNQNFPFREAEKANWQRLPLLWTTRSFNCRMPGLASLGT